MHCLVHEGFPSDILAGGILEPCCGSREQSNSIRMVSVLSNVCKIITVCDISTSVVRLSAEVAAAFYKPVQFKTCTHFVT